MRSLVCLGSLLVLLFLSGEEVHAQLSHPDSFKTRFRGGSAYQEAVEQNQWATIKALKSHPTLGATEWKQNLTAATWDCLIDPKNPTVGTFKQRFFEDTTYATSDIALLYIAGEGPVSGSVTGQPVVAAQNLSARTVTLEHRYYGESRPFPWTDKAGLQYLTVDNAMHDFMSFTKWYNTNVAGKDLTWVVVGGSYAGGLSAWIRTTYPETFIASWSSSGVVNPIFNFYEYDNHIEHVLDPSCVRAVQNIETMATEMWIAGKSKELLKTFGIPEGWLTLQEMQYMLADSSAGAVQYGMKDRMCNAIQPINFTDPLGQYNNMVIDIWGKDFASSCGYSTACLTNKSYYNVMPNGWASADYPWVYQTCSELAWWQIGYPSAIRPKNVSTTYFMNQCKGTFDSSIFPDTFSFDLKHGGNKPTTKGATRVIALQGSDDPWQTAGVRETLSKDYIEVTAQCTGCGHCGDLFSDTGRPAIHHQHEVTLSLLNKWIKEAKAEKKI